MNMGWLSSYIHVCTYSKISLKFVQVENPGRSEGGSRLRQSSIIFEFASASSARTCMAICMINIRPSLRPVRSDLLDILIERRNLTSCGRPNQQHEVFFCNRCRRAPGGAAAPSHPTWDCGSDGLIACRRTCGTSPSNPVVGDRNGRRRPAKSSADTEAAHETATNLADRRRLSAVRREGAGLSAGTMRRRL